MPTFPKSPGDVPSAADWNSLNPLLAEATADGSSLTLEVLNIPQTHRDLQIRIDGDHEAASAQFRDLLIRLNGDSTSGNYRYVRISSLDNGTPTTTANQSSGSFNFGNIGQSSKLTVARAEISNYTAAQNHGITWQIGSTTGPGAGNSYTASGAGSYLGTAAVTSIQAVISAADQWELGSTLRVYGFGLL